MKRRLFFIMAIFPHTLCLAVDKNVFIHQIPASSQLNEEQLKNEAFDAQDEENHPRPKDYQSQILTNSTISDFGRANARLHLTGEEPADDGNSAVIHQEGASNSSIIVQKGRKNKALQVQKGALNDIYLQQEGDDNLSQETQKGKHNHKRIVQKVENNKFDIEQ